MRPGYRRDMWWDEKNPRKDVIGAQIKSRLSQKPRNYGMRATARDGRPRTPVACTPNAGSGLDLYERFQSLRFVQALKFNPRAFESKQQCTGV